MIPHRMLSNEIFANGLRGRVSACRQRLRVNPPAQKAQVRQSVDQEIDQVFLQTSLQAADVPYECGAARRSLIRSKCEGAFADNETGPSEMLLLVEEQEVGIT